MNNRIIANYNKVKSTKLYFPLLLLILIILFLFLSDSLNAKNYVKIQEPIFFYFNNLLGQFSSIEHNLTQIGDETIIFSFLTLFLVKAPKIWESLLSASIVSLIFSSLLKMIFWIPRPQQIYDNSKITIIGVRAIGFSSLPSGHSITIFTTLTVILFAFLPKKHHNKVMYITAFVIIGFGIAMSRVGVGAHHPLDVVIGCIIGYICGLLGIFISKKYNIWSWINDKKFYVLLICLLLVLLITVAVKLYQSNLIIYYFSIASLIISIYKLNHAYAKK
jgi:membrane-associated phospholipid phosphatase